MRLSEVAARGERARRDNSRAEYLQWARTDAFRRRVDVARLMASALGGYAVSFSLGKDSAALAHLCLTTPGGPRSLVHARYGDHERLPDMDAVRAAFFALPGLPPFAYAEARCPGEWEMYERAGGFFLAPTSPEERAACAWWKAEFESRLDALRELAGAEGFCLGLRAEESRARRMNWRMRGSLYERADGRKMALPLATWTGRDVWAYHCLHDLPHLAIYDRSPAGPERERSAYTFATAGDAPDLLWARGKYRTWYECYPEHFRVWMERWPAIAALV